MQLWTMTDKGRLLTDGTVLLNHTQQLSSLQVRAMHNDIHKHQRFSSSLHCDVQSKCGCSCSSFLDQRNGCTKFCLPCSLNTKSCFYPWFVCHDRTLNQQCMLAKAHHPPNDKIILLVTYLYIDFQQHLALHYLYAHYRTCMSSHYISTLSCFSSSTNNKCWGEKVWVGGYVACSQQYISQGRYLLHMSMQIVVRSLYTQEH